MFSKDIHEHLNDAHKEKEAHASLAPESVVPKQTVYRQPDRLPATLPVTERIPERAYRSNEHRESNVKIYFTKDYSMFSSMAGNRTLNRNKITRIKKDIQSGLDVLKYCPVIVAAKENKLEIVDGQHRFAVAKELGSHVWYIIAEELTILEIAKVNSNTEKWKPADYIHCYTSQGNADYRILQDFMNTYEFPLSVSIQLLTKGRDVNDTGGHMVKELLQSGKLKVTQLEEAESVSNIIKQFESFPGHKSRSFVVALCKVLNADKVPVSDLVEAYNANPDKLLMQNSWKDYLVNMEVLVNIGKKIRRVLY